METRPFAPLYGPEVGTGTGSLLPSVTVAASNAAAASGRFPGNNFGGKYQVQIANKTTAWAHVNFGQLGAVTAATVAAGYPVGPTVVVMVTVDPEVNGASVILDSATTGSVVFSVGEGN